MTAAVVASHKLTLAHTSDRAGLHGPMLSQSSPEIVEGCLSEQCGLMVAQHHATAKLPIGFTTFVQVHFFEQLASEEALSSEQQDQTRQTKLIRCCKPKFCSNVRRHEKNHSLRQLHDAASDVAA